MIRVFLPAFYVDDAVADTLGTVAGTPWIELFSRYPEPNETGVRYDSPIYLSVGVDKTDAVEFDNVRVWISVNGGAETLAFDGPGRSYFQSGYAGPRSSYNTTVWNAGMASIVIDPETTWGSEDLITVRVEATSTNGQVLDSELLAWTFQIEDRTLPELVRAQGAAKTTVRVTFNEPMKMDSVAADGALNPSNYTITPLEFPAVTLAVLSASEVSPGVVDLVVDQEMSRGVAYQLDVVGVADAIGNVILPSSVTFSGYLYDVEGRDFNLWRMIPQKSRDEDQGDLWKFIACLQDIADLLLVSIDEWSSVLDVDTAPEDFVDAMLADLGNPFEFDLDLAAKRRLVRVLVTLYKSKGTRVGIEDTIRLFLGIDVQVLSYLVEGWTLGESELGALILATSASYAQYSFEVVSPVALTQTQRDQITSIVDLMKPAHTHLIRITEPTIPTTIDHVELGYSALGDTFILH